MGKVNENTICILDVGSTKTCVVVGEVTDAGLRYRGHGVADSRGSRKGVIVELDKATASIQRAVISRSPWWRRSLAPKFRHRC